MSPQHTYCSLRDRDFVDMKSFCQEQGKETSYPLEPSYERRRVYFHGNPWGPLTELLILMHDHPGTWMSGHT